MLARISRLINNYKRSDELLKRALDLEPENLFAQLNFLGELKGEQNKFEVFIYFANI